MAPTNKAAVLPQASAHPLVIQESEYPTVGKGEIIIKVAAIAINPMDWMIQTLGDGLFSWLSYPFIGGTDVAGTVAEIGPDVTDFSVGDRVLGLGIGFVAREGAFQEYVAVHTNLASRIPDSLSFADASVLPLGLTTAAGALYEPGNLELAYPSLDPKPTGKTLLVWAGASSVGTNAIQLAVASGYEVITTASPKNFDYVKSVGASQVFDYSSPTVVQDLIEAFKGKTSAGGLAIYPGFEDKVFEVVLASEGAKVVIAAMPLAEDKVPAGIERARGIFAGTIKDNEVGGIIFNKFVPEALAAGKFRALPPPVVVGEGLESLQEAVDKLKGGAASAKKLVVTL
ncbi:chaperonin 10-like protein [Podospora didyma]|uniref:Chaperonin 10-like protein n=1 Tax=Podospora didyma TaxID=330526 RepID=A0AAE0NPA1_9PEZI|nr:chaperonin 10-like protein [Podospora didyma]